MIYQRAQTISLKSSPEYNEVWLHKQIAADTSILGLGDLVVRDVERPQPRAGRLDLLLSDPDSGTRYEVEIQLGPTDESHIIRTIEYWDIERNRFPQTDHVAVIVAEDITSRFLNVISLFNKSIPLVAIQMNALQVGDAMTLHATTVLNLMPAGSAEDDEVPGQSTDRAYWEQRASAATVALADDFLAAVNAVAPGHELKYNKYYIGLAQGGFANNFMVFRPRRGHLIVEFRVPQSEELGARFEATGMDFIGYDKRHGSYKIRASKPDLIGNAAFISEVITLAAGATPIGDEPHMA